MRWLDTFDGATREDVTGAPTRISNDRHVPAVRDARLQADAVVGEANRMQTRLGRRRHVQVQRGLDARRVHDDDFNGMRRAARNEPVQYRLFTDRQRAIVRCENRERKRFARDAARTASDPAARRATQRRLIDRLGARRSLRRSRGRRACWLRWR